MTEQAGNPVGIKLSVLMVPGPHVPGLAVKAEEAGFDTIWMADSPVVFGDPFVSLATAAAHTSSIKLATGVINTSTRTPIMSAAALASLNAYAPGRIVCGIGVGHTGARALGLPVGRLADLPRHVQELRTLRGGGEICTTSGTYQRFINTAPFLNVDDPIPIYVAAAGRKSIPLAAGVADGIVLGGIADPAVIGHARQLAEAGRSGPAGHPSASKPLPLAITPSSYLSQRALSFGELRELIGPKSLAPARNFATLVTDMHGAAADLTRDVSRLKTAMDSKFTPGQPGDTGREHLAAFSNYITKLDDGERELVTERVLAMTSLAGTPDDWLAKLDALERAGVAEVIVSPLPQFAEELIGLCGRHIIPATGTPTRRG